jgi:sortase (surface protein transpeptidase)
MNRRNVQLAVLCSLLIALMFPVSITSTQALESRSSSSEWKRSIGTTIQTDTSAYDVTRTASSMEYEFPAPPPERERSECERISRFCEWLAQHGVLIENEDNVAGSENDTAANGFTDSGQGNRSAVGWQSASVSTIQANSSPDPVALNIPSLSISADVADVGIDQNREMEVPNDYNTVGWYRYGPRPGDEGSSVIAGHLDDAQGRSVFFDLQYIELGAEISIVMEDGSSQDFYVTAKVAYDSQNLPPEIFSREGNPQLALLTCGGTWDSSAGRYTETVVVFAAPVR